MLKKMLTVSLAFCMALSLAACGNGNDTAVATSVTPSDDSSTSTPDTSGSTGTSSTPADGADVQALADELATAAALGDNKINSMELDLKAGGVNLDDVAAFAGYESQTYSDNGGIVLVVQAVSGAVDSVKQGLESFKTSRMDDRYAEFATQLENTSNARIVSNGDVVVMAVSATAQSGGWDALDAALSEKGFS